MRCGQRRRASQDEGSRLCRCLADDLRGRSAHERKPEPGMWFAINGIFNVIAYLLIV
jgi:hypothetical protein